MNDSLARLTANFEVVFAWLGTTSFILAYHFGTPGWRLTPVGRTLMHRAFSMWLLLSFALTSRLLEPTPEIRNLIAVVIYFLIGVMEWRLFLILRFIQEGKITLENPHYTPVRNWWRRVTKKEV
jgi:hypothetical protein